MTTKNSTYVKIYSVNPLYLIFSNVNEYFEKINKSKYLTLVPGDESKEKVMKCKELWSNIRELISSITKNNSVDELPQNKTTKISTMTIVVRAVFYENNKYYLQVFSDECLYKIFKWRVKMNKRS